MNHNDQQLQFINMNGERVLLTAQLAEAYGTKSKIISRNFQRNISRFTEGKHYFELCGEELRQFKEGSRQIDDNLKYASVIQLWTEKGAWLHAKSLNTDQAWEAYEMLVDDYYRTEPQMYKEALLALIAAEEEKEHRQTAQIATTLSNQNTKINKTEKGWI